MAEKSTKPYLIRAIHEWCADSGLTPYLSVKVDENTRVPLEHVKNGEIVLNLSYDATHRLTIGEEGIQFSARFGGVSRECSVPMGAVTGIFARENGQGLFFQSDEVAGVPEEMEAAEPEAQAAPAETASPPATPPAPTTTPPAGGRPKLQVVK